MSNYRSAPGLPSPHVQHQGITLAVRLVRAYGKRVPSVEELQRTFAMSRATAYRWRAALSDSGATKVQGAH